MIVIVLLEIKCVQCAKNLLIFAYKINEKRRILMKYFSYYRYHSEIKFNVIFGSTNFIPTLRKLMEIKTKL